MLAGNSMVEILIYTGLSPWTEEASGATNQNSLSICENTGKEMAIRRRRRKNIFFRCTDSD
jgi:hypothetical protein